VLKVVETIAAVAVVAELAVGKTLAVAAASRQMLEPYRLFIDKMHHSHVALQHYVQSS